jgi:hypothetical protein
MDPRAVLGRRADVARATAPIPHNVVRRLADLLRDAFYLATLANVVSDKGVTLERGMIALRRYPRRDRKEHA